jgi:hypothetical protein
MLKSLRVFHNHDIIRRQLNNESDIKQEDRPQIEDIRDFSILKLFSHQIYRLKHKRLIPLAVGQLRSSNLFIVLGMTRCPV